MVNTSTVYLNLICPKPISVKAIWEVIAVFWFMFFLCRFLQSRDNIYLSRNDVSLSLSVFDIPVYRNPLLYSPCASALFRTLLLTLSQRK